MAQGGTSTASMQAWTNLIWAYATLGHYDRPLFEEAATRIEAMLTQIGRSTRGSGSGQAAGTGSGRWLGDATFVGQFLSTTLWSFGVVAHDCREEDGGGDAGGAGGGGGCGMVSLLDTVVREMPWVVEHLTTQGLANTTFALALLGQVGLDGGCEVRGLM